MPFYSCRFVIIQTMDLIFLYCFGQAMVEYGRVQQFRRHICIYIRWSWNTIKLKTQIITCYILHYQTILSYVATKTLKAFHAQFIPFILFIVRYFVPKCFVRNESLRYMSYIIYFWVEWITSIFQIVHSGSRTRFDIPLVRRLLCWCSSHSFGKGRMAATVVADEATSDWNFPTKRFFFIHLA